MPEAVHEKQLDDMEPKKYIVVKNHVREITEPRNSIKIKNTETLKDESKECKKKSKKRAKPEKHLSSSEDDGLDVRVNEISESDLEELKTVYKNCKEILLKIESKYGHLLNLGDECSPRKRIHGSCQDKCRCSLNSKVIFNDDGQTLSVGSSSKHHICPDRLKTYNRYCKKIQNVQIEDENFNITLPDNIQELEEMLKDPLLPSPLRNKVIDRIKLTRHVNSNMIRCDKQSLIEKMKTNPDDIIDFKGTNFSSIVGYPSNPI